MFKATIRRAAAHAERQPMIKFLGKRQTPSSIDHSPHVHPMAPNNILPSASYAPSANSFSSYRQQAQQHGPLRHTFSPEAGIGATPGSALGPVEPAKGQYFDRSELPARFKRTPLTEAEIEAIEQGGATSIW